MPPGMAGHSPDIGTACDPVQARRILAEAGYPDARGVPALEALIPPGWHRRLGEGILVQWQQNLGVEVAKTSVEWEEFLENLDLKPPHVWFMRFMADYPDPDSFLRTGSWRKEVGWQHTAYDRLVEEARQVTDQKRRIDLFQQADRMLIEEVPILPLTYGRQHLLVKHWARIPAMSPMTGLFYKDFVIEPQ